MEMKFTNAQQREIDEGYKNGLTTDQVSFYSNPQYDNLQMKQIRLALQDGYDEKQMQSFLNPEVPWESMQHFRESLSNSNMIDEQAETKVRARKLKNMFSGVLILVLVFVLAVGIYVANRVYSILNQELQIDLKQDEVTLQYGAAFNPMLYVESYTQEENVELILPDEIDTSMICDVDVVYLLKNQLKSITETMKVHIVDTTPPDIILSNQEVTLTRGEQSFVCKAYLSNAMDEVDGDLTSEVACTDIDESLNEQTVVYSVKDCSGNTAEKKLKVKFVDPPEPETIIVYKDPMVPQQPINPTKPSQDRKPSSGSTSVDRTSGSQNFMFSDGYDMDSGYQACIAAGNAHGAYSCTPLQNEEGIYIGYRLDY